MPVHRPALKDRSAVVAFSDELDRWLSRTAAASDDKDDKRVGEAERRNALVGLQDNMSRLARQSSELASQTKSLQADLKRSLENHRTRVASRMRARTAASPDRGMGAMLPFRLARTSERQLLIP
jgi:hypothetical protein